MSAFWWIFGACALIWNLIIYPLAQTQFVHSQSYAVIDALFLIAIVRRVFMESRPKTATGAPKEETIALAGISLASFATLLCCLLAPETQMLIGAPGQRVPIGDTNISLRFPLQPAIRAERQSLKVEVLRRENVVGNIGMHAPYLIGDMIMSLHEKPVATIAARELGGDTLTITQPTGAGFLSPILRFEKMVPIADIRLPSDTFAIPALHRNVHAFLITQEAMRDQRVARLSKNAQGVLFSVSDAQGKTVEHGIGFAADGLPQQISNIVFMPKIGVYPDVSVSSAPQPMPMIIGIVAYIFAGASYLYRVRKPIVPSI